MATERQIGNPDYVGVWFSNLPFVPSIGPFLLYVTDHVQPASGEILDCIGLAEFHHGIFTDEYVEFAKTYTTDSHGRRLSQTDDLFRYSGKANNKGVISGKWRQAVSGETVSGKFLMQTYGSFMQEQKKIKSPLANSWLEAQIESLELQYKTGLVHLIETAEKRVLVILGETARR